MRKCIMVVSFGTTDLTGLKQNIEAMENEVRDRFGSDYTVIKVFTSNMIRKKIKEVYNISIFNTTEALEWLKEEGYEEVIVQPLYIIPGKEYDSLINTCNEYKCYFKNISIGTPLLSGNKDDYISLINAIKCEIYDVRTYILVGHGSSHTAHKYYEYLQKELIHSGFSNVYIGTLQSYPNVFDMVNILKKNNITDVCIMPFLLVCGGHVKRDINGEENSWKSIFIENGINVYVKLKSLGEYPKIREIYINKIIKTIENSL